MFNTSPHFRKVRFSKLPVAKRGLLTTFAQKLETQVGVATELPSSVVDPDLDEEMYVKVVENGLGFSCRSPTKVAIIGAGLAGLSAAQVLGTGSYNVTLFEATNRIGGRVHTVRGPFFNDNYAEVGAMRIPQGHRIVNTYLNKFLLKTEPFNGYDANGFYYIYGKSFNIGKYQTDPLELHSFLASHNFELNDELLTPRKIIVKGKEEFRPLRIDEFWEITFQNLLTKVDYPKEASIHSKDAGVKSKIYLAWQKLCDDYDVSFRQYLTKLANPVWKEGTMELFGLIGSGIGGYPKYYLNVREEISLRSKIDDPDVEMREIIGGNDKLAEAFVANVGLDQSILLGAKVTAITRLNNKYTISYKKDKYDLEEGGFDHVIMTIPFTQMPSIVFTPALSVPKLRAIRELHYQHASKVILQFKNRFWLDPKGPLRFGHGGALSTDLPIKNVYFPDHGTGRGVIIAAYTWESDALYWASKSAEEQKRDALQQLATVIQNGSPNPIDIRPLYEGGEVKNWSTDPHTAGAYAFFEPSQMSELFEHVVSREGENGTIHFAGEHASFDHAWIEGALQSGIRVALEINDAEHSHSAG